MDEQTVYFGARLKVRAANTIDALGKVEENCKGLLDKIPLSKDGILAKEIFLKAEANVGSCVKGVPIPSGVYISPFNVTEHPLCKGCIANMKGKCTTNIFIGSL